VKATVFSFGGGGQVRPLSPAGKRNPDTGGNEVSMLTKIMKWVSVAVLLLTVLRLPSASLQILLEIVVCVSGLLVATQAVRANKYFWAAGFVAITLLFNPIAPIALSRRIFLWLDWVCIAAFLLSLAALKSQPILSMPSITGRTPGSESL
jgi:hypothetical protein